MSATIDSLSQLCSDKCTSYIDFQLWNFLVGGGIGAVIGWFLNAAKTWRETKKLGAEEKKLNEEREKLASEAVKLRTESIKNKNEIETKHNDACIQLESSIDLVIKSIQASDMQGLDANREIACNIITTKVLFYFKQLTEMKAAIYTQPELMLREYAFKELERYDQWLKVINHKSILERLGKSPLKISKSFFYEFREIISRCANESESEMLDRLQVIANSMNE